MPAGPALILVEPLTVEPDGLQLGAGIEEDISRLVGFQGRDANEPLPLADVSVQRHAEAALALVILPPVLQGLCLGKPKVLPRLVRFERRYTLVVERRFLVAHGAHLPPAHDAG